MSQIMILDRSTSGCVRANHTYRLIAVITNLLLKKFAQIRAKAELPKIQKRTIQLPAPSASGVTHPHIDRFLQRIDR
ncbi:MAG: hypothetical protein SCM11_11525 [Bacillota bacterium]|nr:hypothetical protein [Bacillota bacterium]